MAITLDQINNVTKDMWTAHTKRKLIEDLKRNHDMDEVKRELEREEQEERKKTKIKNLYAYAQYVDTTRNIQSKYYDMWDYGQVPRVIQQVVDDSEDVDFTE